MLGVRKTADSLYYTSAFFLERWKYSLKATLMLLAAAPSKWQTHINSLFSSLLRVRLTDTWWQILLDSTMPNRVVSSAVRQSVKLYNITQKLKSRSSLANRAIHGNTAQRKHKHTSLLSYCLGFFQVELKLEHGGAKLTVWLFKACWRGTKHSNVDTHPCWFWKDFHRHNSSLA